MIKNKYTILVLEDDRSLADIIKTKLEMEGFNVFVVDTVQKGIDALKQNKVDFIWLDHYLLGGENGIAFVRKISKVEDWSQIPIFVVSNNMNTEDMGEYLSLGVTKYYLKSDNRIDDIVTDLKNTLSEKA